MCNFQNCTHIESNKSIQILGDRCTADIWPVIAHQISKWIGKNTFDAVNANTQLVATVRFELQQWIGENVLRRCVSDRIEFNGDC